MLQLRHLLIVFLAYTSGTWAYGQEDNSTFLMTDQVSEFDHFVKTIKPEIFDEMLVDMSSMNKKLHKTPFSFHSESAAINLRYNERPIIIFLRNEKPMLSAYFKLNPERKIVEVESDWNELMPEENHLHMAYKPFENPSEKLVIYKLLNFHSPYLQSDSHSSNFWMYQTSSQTRAKFQGRLIDWSLPVAHQENKHESVQVTMNAGIYANTSDSIYIANSIKAFGLNSVQSKTQIELIKTNLPFSQLAYVKFDVNNKNIRKIRLRTNWFTIESNKNQYTIVFSNQNIERKVAFN